MATMSETRSPAQTYGPRHLEGVRRPAKTRRATGAAFYLVCLFIVGLAVPIQIMVGPVRLSPYRLVLVATFLPVLFMILSGRVGAIRKTDAFLVLYVLWASLALFRIHGPGFALEPAGIHVIEVLASYGLARVFIRSPADFQRAYKLVIALMACILPFTMYESLSGSYIVLDTLDKVFTVPRPHYEKPPRMGLFRAQGPFEHSILYGVFCASVFGIAFFSAKGAKRVRRVILVSLATLFSVSAGPLVAFVTQVGLIVWHFIMVRLPYKWWIFTALAICAYIVVDVLSNRTPFEVFISYLTFNTSNAYNRVLIWEYGTRIVFANPIFGIGMNSWDNAWYMSGSMDNFWLVNAVRFGMPAFLFLAIAILSAFFAIAKKRKGTQAEKLLALGWCVSILGFTVAGTTAHFWNAVFCFFFFMLGSGMWMLDQPVQRPSPVGDRRNAAVLGNARNDKGRQEPRT